MILLVDERPEEVTDFRRLLGKPAEIFASSNDQSPREPRPASPSRCWSKAKRMVEQGQDVVMLFDSLTRMTRAYNNQRAVGRPHDDRRHRRQALLGPRAFFGAARAIENGGSLTIIGTVLVDTGSRMDDIIFEEFKGTGNMELYLVARALRPPHLPGVRRGEIGHAPRGAPLHGRGDPARSVSCAACSPISGRSTRWKACSSASS